MKMYLRAGLAIAAVTSLSACLGGGGDDDFVVSEGLLTLELPADRSDLPENLRESISDIERLNEDPNTLVDDTPNGSSEYIGDFGFVLDDAGVLISGDAVIGVAANGTDISMTFTATHLDNVEGDIAGSMKAQTTQSGGFYSGNVSGEYRTYPDSLDPMDYAFEADVRGVFVGGGTTYGDLEGTATGITDDTQFDTFGGLFIAMEP